LAVLGGPVGIAISAGLVASAFFSMGGSAKAAAVDVDALTLSLNSLNTEQLAFRRQQAEEKLEELQEKAAEAAQSLRSVERDYAALEKMFRAGRGVDAEGLKNVEKTLIELRAGVADANQEVEKAIGVIAKLDEAAKVAAGGIAKLNEAQAQTSEAAKSYLERLADRALLAGLKTQREQLDALIKAGKLVFSEPDLKRVRDYADAIDRANAAIKATDDPTPEKDPGADYVQNLKERIALLGKSTEYEQLLARIRAGALDLGAHEAVALQKAKEIDLAQQQIETERVLKDLRDQQATTQMQFMRELESFGEGENVRALNADLAKTEDHYRRLIEARRNSAHGLSDTELAQIQASLQEELEMVRQFHDDKLAIQQDWKLGAEKALRDYADEAQNLYAQVGDAVSRAFKGMEDALATFVSTGKMDFRSLADSIIQDMIRIAIQQSVTGPLARAFGGWMAGLGGAGGSVTVGAATSVGTGASAAFSTGGYTGNGGRYEPAGIVHKGEGVLNQDEIRAIGGEAGFNALRRAIRGPGHAMGGMAGRPMAGLGQSGEKAPKVTIHIHNEGGEAKDFSEATPGLEAFGKVMQQIARAEYQKLQVRDYQAGGLHWRARQGMVA